MPQVTSGGFWGEGWDDPLITTPTNNVYGGVLDILGHASKSVPNLSFGFIESLKEVKIPGGGKIIGDCYYKFKPYTFFEKFYKRNFLDRAISFPKNTFPSFFNGLRFLAPLNFFSDIKELADSINSDKNIPEKGADIVASSASLYSSSIGTAQLLGVNTTALSGSATIADTPLIAATALLAAAFAGGYAFGQWFDKKTGWHHSTATRGLKVEQALKDAGLNDTFSGIVGGVPLFHF